MLNCQIVGTNIDKIVNEVELLISNSEEYKKMSQAHNPYGDGLASKRIVEFLINQKKYDL